MALERRRTAARQRLLLLGWVLAGTLSTRALPAQPRSEATKPAAADPRSEARALGYSGVSAYRSGDYATASTQLEQAYRLLQIPTLGMWSARALAKVGLLIEAVERYRQVPGLPLDVGDESIQREAMAQSDRERVELLPLIPVLTIRVSGAAPEAVELLLDGEKVSMQRALEGLPLNPGRHELLGQLGSERITNTLSFVERQRETITLRFSPAAVAPLPPAAGAPTPLAGGSGAAPAQTPLAAASPADDRRRSWRTAAWISLGVGGAGLATGVVAYFIGQPKRAAIDRDPACRNGVCTSEASDKVNSYNPIRTVNLVGLVSGGALTAAGATLLILMPPPVADLALRIGPTGLALDLHF